MQASGSNSVKGAPILFSIGYHPHLQPKEASGKLYLLQDPETLLPVLVLILKHAELPLFSKTKPPFTSAVVSSLPLPHSSGVLSHYVSH